MTDKQLTDEEKQKECERICGKHDPKYGIIHRTAPEMCPIKMDEWKHPKRKKDY